MVELKAPADFKDKELFLEILTFMPPRKLLQMQFICQEWYNVKVP